LRGNTSNASNVGTPERPIVVSPPPPVIAC
jgi:hypothetical protein